jgi:hypothetical protein
MQRRPSLLLGLCLTLASAALSAAPQIDIGKGGQCVEETSWMRKNHMNVLKHQRDEVVYKGVRDAKHSLKTCIECHASVKDDSVSARADSFCVACHAYQAVKIDCFECHANKRKSAWVSGGGQ